MKSPLAILLSVSLASMLYGQQPTPLEKKLDESVTGQPATGETSDVGAQTPVDGGGAINSYAGVDLRYLYRDNALSVNEPLSNAVKSGILMHTFYAGAILPSKPFMDGAVTPFIGASRTDVYHDNKDLESFPVIIQYIVREQPNRPEIPGGRNTQIGLNTSSISLLLISLGAMLPITGRAYISIELVHCCLCFSLRRFSVFAAMASRAMALKVS